MAINCGDSEFIREMPVEWFLLVESCGRSHWLASRANLGLPLSPLVGPICLKWDPTFSVA